MKKKIVLLTILITYGCAFEIKNSAKPTIIDGEDASPGEFPFFAVLSNLKRGVGCSGSLIREDLVLTSALCAEMVNAGSSLVRVGTHRSGNDPNADTRLTSQAFTHPDWFRNGDYVGSSNIGLVLLTRPFDLSNRIQLITLEQHREDSTETVGTVVGWGAGFEGDSVPLPTLQKVQLSIIDDAVCQEHFKNLTRFEAGVQFCAGAERKGLCYGDEGGAFLLGGRQTLYGIFSRNYACALDPISGLFTRVSPFIPWIEDKMKETASNGAAIRELSYSWTSFVIITLISIRKIHGL